MKNIFLILTLFIGLSSTAQTKIKYAPNRTNGDVIVTDMALRAGEFFQIPTTTLQSPSIGSYVDSTGRIFYSRFDSTLIVRNNGSWFRYFNSNKINAMDALVVHLAGTETITGAKTFNGNITSAGITTVGNDIIWNNNTGYGLKAQDGVRYLSYTSALGAVMPRLRIGGGSSIQPGDPLFTLIGKAWISDTINAAGLIRPANDIIWSNNSGFGLRGSDGVRYLYYTTALGPVATTLRIGGTTIQNGNPQLTVQGKAFITDTLNGSNANFAGTTRTTKLIGNSSTPSIVGGSSTYIGTGASTGVIGNDIAGIITLTTGTGCSSTGLSNRSAFTVTFANSYTTPPVVIIQSIQRGGLESTDGPSQNFFIRRDNSGATSFTVYLPIGITLSDNTTYEINYHVIGK